jgi:hypothetical protein
MASTYGSYAKKIGLIRILSALNEKPAKKAFKGFVFEKYEQEKLAVLSAENALKMANLSENLKKDEDCRNVLTDEREKARKAFYTLPEKTPKKDVDVAREKMEKTESELMAFTSEKETAEKALQKAKNTLMARKEENRLDLDAELDGSCKSSLSINKSPLPPFVRVETVSIKQKDLQNFNFVVDCAIRFEFDLAFNGDFSSNALYPAILGGTFTDEYEEEKPSNVVDVWANV